MLDNFLGNFTPISRIGEGSFSEVFKVKNKKLGAFYAAKRLTKPYSSLEEAENCAELRTLRKLEYHQNVLSLVEFVYEPQNGSLTLIFDLMDMSLYDYIKNRKKTLSETKCKNFLFQLVRGLAHLHRIGIFHRDIKPENILLRQDLSLKNHPLKKELVQIADLGSVCSSTIPLPHTAYISTRWYRAPECLLTSGFYGAKMDVWALGCCFYEIMTLNPLFPGENELDQLHKIHDIVGSPNQKLLERFKHRNVEYEFPKKKPLGFHNLIPSMSDLGVDVMKKMLVYQPENRISAMKLQEHIYFEELRAKNRNHASANRLKISTSVNVSRENLSSKISKTYPARQSLNNSRGSMASDSSTRSKAIIKLQEAQSKLNKQMERCWGMNVCPIKQKTISTIKSSVQGRKKTFRSDQTFDAKFKV